MSEYEPIHSFSLKTLKPFEWHESYQKFTVMCKFIKATPRWKRKPQPPSLILVSALCHATSTEVMPIHLKILENTIYALMLFFSKTFKIFFSWPQTMDSIILT